MNESLRFQFGVLIDPTTLIEPALHVIEVAPTVVVGKTLAGLGRSLGLLSAEGEGAEPDPGRREAACL